MKTILSLVCLVMVSSCMSFSDRAMRPVAHSIQAQIPQLRLEKEFAMSIGSSVFNMLDIVVLDSPDISKLDHVDVAIYRVSDMPHGIDFGDLDFGQSLVARGKHLEWETIVKVRDERERVWVLAGMDMKRQALSAITVFVLNEEELVLISANGKLDQLLRFAMKPADDRRDELHAQNHQS